MDKKVTIIIPVYNAGANIEHCIQSILKQTSRDFKVLLINDGSTDDSLIRITEYANRYPDIFKVLTHENISKEEAKKRALEMISLVGIPMPEKVFASCPHQLSGGMRQRIMIAMALSCKPSLLICDEPTTALDVTIQAQILKLINRLKYEMNSSVLLITHDMGVISEMADNVIVMYAGKIVEYTSVNDLFKNPLHPYTVGLMKSIPDIDSDSEEELEVIPGSVPMLYELPEGCFFAPRCKYAKDLCHKKCPAMIDVGDGHLVRCWKYHEEWQKGDK